MVYHVDLDLVFHALADGTRRSILQDLATGRRTVTELATPHAMSLPAVSKHLRVLERAGLVTRSREGRVHRMSFRGEPLSEVVDWMEHYRAFWDASFDALAAIVDEPRKRAPKKEKQRERP